jgi:uncharacterized membrane protein
MQSSTEVPTADTQEGRIEGSASSISWAWILMFLALGTTWGWAAFVRGRGYNQARQLLLVTVIGVCVAVVVVLARQALLRRSALPRRDIARLLAFSCCAFLLLAVFLPEYLLGKPQVFLRSFILLGLCLLLLRAYVRTSTQRDSSARIPVLPPVPALIGFCLIYFAATTYVALTKLWAFGYVGQDIAYFTQCLYTTLHGHLFYSNMYHDLLYGKPVGSDLAGHNQPVLFLFLPFYLLHKSASTLLIVRNIFVVMCAWPVYLIGRRFLSPAMAAIAAAAFLLVPAVLYQNFYDFAPLSLAAFPLLFAIYYFLENRFFFYVAALICTQMVREDLVLTVFGLGVLALWRRRGPRWVLFPCGFALVWALLTWKVIFPHFLNGASSAVGGCFAYLGSSPLQALRYIIAHPGILLSRNALIYIKQVVDPFGGVLALLNPLSLLAMPYVAVNLLGDAGGCNFAMIYRHYALVPTVLLFGSFMMSAESMGSWWPWKSQQSLEVRQSAVVLFVLFAALSSTILITGQPQFAELQSRPWHGEATRVAAMLPRDASVAVPRYMLPSLANRDTLYQSLRLLEYHHPEASYIVIDKDWQRMAATEQWHENYNALWHLLETSQRYTVIYNSANYVIYKLCDGCASDLPHREPMKEMHD